MYPVGNPNGGGRWDDDEDAAVSHGALVERSCPPGINCPTVSQWGLAIMGVLLVTAATVLIRERTKIVTHEG